MKPVFHAFSTLVLGAAASVGAQGLDVSLDGDTGRLLSVAVDGEIVLAADPNVAEAVKFDCDGNAGSWRYGFDWRVHEEERMLQGTLSFEWLGDEPVRLKGLRFSRARCRLERRRRPRRRAARSSFPASGRRSGERLQARDQAA